MIRSMTGFGEASDQVDGNHFAVELRSLNNKYFKATIRLPEEIVGLEAELEATLRKHISRGALSLVVKMRSSEVTTAQQVNQTALLTYLGHLESVHSKVIASDRNAHIDLTALLALPGVLEPTEDEQTLLSKVRPTALRLTEQACERLLTMRTKEGHAIWQDLARHRQAIIGRIESIKARTPTVVEEYHKRLRARIDELHAKAELKVDEHDLIREVAIFAERSDIAEEVTRLAAHLEQFEQIVDAPGGEPTGRTLDFLTQELLREANTIASKSNDALVSRIIVEVKGVIDRIKEQVQNIE